MTDCCPAPGRPAATHGRSAPGGDGLELGDYRAMFGVLDDVVEARDVHDLGDRLADALARHLGWRNAAVGVAPSLDLQGSMRDGRCYSHMPKRMVDHAVRRWTSLDPVVSTKAATCLRAVGVCRVTALRQCTTRPRQARDFVESFLAPLGMEEAFRILLGTGQLGAATVVVLFPDQVAAGRRALTVAHVLRRHLGPVFRVHLAGSDGRPQGPRRRPAPAT